MALVLSRREGEEICIGDHIVVRVSRLSGSRVRLAISAPPQTRIVRAEVDRPQTEAEEWLRECDRAMKGGDR